MSIEEMVCISACEKLEAVKAEHGEYASFHEAYAVLQEEMDELFDEIKKKRAIRSVGRIADEAMDIAVAALKLVLFTRKEKSSDALLAALAKGGA